MALGLAKRWSKVAAVLFAVGAVSGTILSFEMGLLWPELMRTYGDVIGLPFALEGIAFFVEAIFIGIYLYGWGRLPPRVHLATLVPIAVSGVVGTFCILAVNSWMNGPTGFRLVDGEVDRRRPVGRDVQPAACGCSSPTCGWPRSWSSGSAPRRSTPPGCSAAATTATTGSASRVPFAFATVAALVPAGRRPPRSAPGSPATQPAKLAAMELAAETEAPSPLVIGGRADRRRASLRASRSRGWARSSAGANIDRPVTGLDEIAADERPDDALVTMVHSRSRRWSASGSR